MTNIFKRLIVFMILLLFSVNSCIKSQENGYNDLNWGSNTEALKTFFPNAVLAFKGGESRRSSAQDFGFFIERYELLLDENYDKYNIPGINVYCEKRIHTATEHEAARYFFYKDDKLFKVWYQLDIKPNEFQNIFDMIIEKYGRPTTTNNNPSGGWEYSNTFWNINKNQHILFGTTHYGTYRSWGYILYYDPEILKEIDTINNSNNRSKFQL
jgi:hypothetical protein